MIQKFKVTKKILKEAGVACKSGFLSDGCAIVMALRTRYPLACAGIDHIYLDGIGNNEGDEAVIPLPKRVRTYARTFDSLSYQDRIKLPEFEFELDIPESVNQSI